MPLNPLLPTLPGQLTFQHNTYRNIIIPKIRHSIKIAPPFVFPSHFKLLPQISPMAITLRLALYHQPLKRAETESRHPKNPAKARCINTPTRAGRGIKRISRSVKLGRLLSGRFSSALILARAIIAPTTNVPSPADTWRPSWTRGSTRQRRIVGLQRGPCGIPRALSALLFPSSVNCACKPAL